MRNFKRMAALIATVIMAICSCFCMTGCSIDDISNLFGGLKYELGGLTGETDLEDADEAVVEMMIKAANNIRGNLMLLGQDSEEAVKSLSVSSAKVKYWDGTGGGVVYCKLTYKYSGMTEVSYCQGNISDYNKISNFRAIESYQWEEVKKIPGEGYKWASINVRNINTAYDYYLEHGHY